MTKWGPFFSPLTIARRGMSIGPFACIHIEGQSSQNGGSSPGLLRPNGHSGVPASKEAEHLWRVHARFSIFCPFRSLALD